MKKKFKENIIQVNKSIKDAILKLSSLKIKNLLVVDYKNKFIGSITDGDLRRYTLKNNFDLKSNLDKIYKSKSIYIDYKKKIINLNRLIKERKKILIPILDKDFKIIDIKVSDEKKSFIDKSEIKVLILAGGEGKRLRPITKYLPKPLIKINEKTVIEILIENLFNYNFNDISISINYRAEKIKNYLQKIYGKLILKFLQEDKPLGTAGPISKLNISKHKNILLINSDIITEINFDKLINFHLKNNYDLTLAGYKHKTPFNYGVVKNLNNKSILIDEKPLINNVINSGIYIFKSNLIKFVPNNEYLDMPNFINKLKKKEVGNI